MIRNVQIRRPAIEQPAIQELRALRHEADLALPEDAQQLFGPYVALYRGEHTSGDELSLPRVNKPEAQAIAALLDRAGSAGGLEEMCSVLAAYQKDSSEIRRRANSIEGAIAR